MKAYIVVGPTKLQPRFFKSFDIAIDSGHVGCISLSTVGCAVRSGLEALEDLGLAPRPHLEVAVTDGVLDRGNVR